MSAADAHAYVRTRGQNNGPYLYWNRLDVAYVTESKGSEDMWMGDLLREIAASFQTWEDVECSDLGFADRGVVMGEKAGYSQLPGASNTNLLIWYENSREWIYQEGIIAVTTNTFDPYTGEIFDADIEFNGFEFTFTGGDSHILTDVRNTATHEIGHVIGLDHSPVPNSTMYATAPMGDTSKRTLADDDIKGICEVYPNGRPLTPADGGDEVGGCDCRSAGLAESSGLMGLALLFLLRRRLSD